MKSNSIKAILLALLTIGWNAKGDVYKESGGVVVIDAIHYDYHNFEFTDAAIPHHFHVQPDDDGKNTPDHPWGDTPDQEFQNSRSGHYLRILPDNGSNKGNCPTCPNENVGFPPYAEYKVDITTLGTYQLYLRQVGFDGGSDSFFAQILEFAPPGPGPNFYRYAPDPDGADFDALRNNPGDAATENQGWSGYAAPAPRVDGGGGEVPALYNITKAGLYTIRMSQREDGAGVDAVCLQLASLPAPSGKGPAESVVSTTAPPYVRAVDPTPGQQQVPPDNGLSCEIVDAARKVNVSSISVTVNGAKVTPVVTQNGKITSVKYSGPLFPSGQQVSWSVTYNDDGTPAKTYTESFPFTVLAFAPIPPSFAVPAGSVDTSKPGFKVRTAQTDGVGSLPQNSIARAEAALNGTLIDPNTGSSYANNATPGPNSDGSYDEPAIINYDKAPDVGHGNFLQPGNPDVLFPGLPGSNGSDDNTAMEAITWLDLQPGVYRMVVNSDDNFRVSVAPDPHDKAGLVLGEFDDPAGRGATDSLFIFVVEKAGIYPFRLVWENGGGDSNVEWFTQNVFGRRALINDKAAAGYVKAYRSGPSYPYATKFTTSPYGFAMDFKDNGGIVVNKDSVKITVDGAAVSAAVTKAGSVTSISYTSPTILTSGSTHTIGLAYNDSATPPVSHSRDIDFTVQAYATLPASYAAGAADTSKPGFSVRVNEIDAGGATVQPNTIAYTEQQLSGTVTNSATGKPYDNVATPNGNSFIYTETGAINYDATSDSGANGNFPNDARMPGFPGTSGSTDNAAAEILTYLTLPAGLVTMGVNSDDGFRLSPAASVDSSQNALTLGVFDGGRGSADTIFSFYVPTAGTYPMRLIWENGNGGANVEWFSVDSTGKKTLINDTAAGAIKAYRAAASAPPPPAEKPKIDSATIASGTITIKWSNGGTLESATSITGGTWTSTGNSSGTFSEAATGAAKFYRVKR
ncbi:MAG: hypothetical protein HY043_05000 [Verrucomicrobia bacterium]|nr:hypothetical protein [Verrucomicrobiota bacterium]